MPVVRMPNGDQVRFPDDMSQDQIRSMISKKFPDAQQSGMFDSALGAARGVGQGAVGSLLDITGVLPDVMSLRGADDKARQQGRAELKRFADEPSKSDAQSFGQTVGGGLPYLAMGPTGLGELAASQAIKLGPAAVHAAAHIIGHHMGAPRWLARLAGHWFNSLGLHRTLAPAAGRAGATVEHAGATIAGGARGATRGDSDGQKAEGRRPEKPRKPPVQSGEPVARRPRGAEYRNNGPAAAQRPDSRWSDPNYFRRPQSETGEAR